MEYLINNAMNINKIQELSKLYNEIALFFSKYKPQRCIPYAISEDIPISNIKTIWKVFKPDPIIYTANDFIVWYDNFRMVISEYIHSYEKETVQAIIKYYFKSTLFTPNVTELLKCEDVLLVDLLEAFVKATKFINGLIDRTVLCYGLIDQYDSFKEESGREKKKENYYTDEDVENCIQKMIVDGTCAAIVNKTIRDVGNDEAIGLLQNNYQRQESCQKLSEGLDTNKAKEYFSNAIIAGFMDENYHWKGTKYQAALFAEICSEKLGLKHKWKPFEILWEVRYLAQTRRESKERFGKVDKEYEIEAIFK